MKKFTFILYAGILLAIMSCNSTPSSNAERSAEDAAAAAQDQAVVAAEQRAAADANAVGAMEKAVVATADELMSKVPMPTFKSKEAEMYAKKIGNHVVDFVNAGDPNSASIYATKVKDELATVDQLAAKGKISAEDTKAIKDYATSLLNAAGIATTK